MRGSAFFGSAPEPVGGDRKRNRRVAWELHPVLTEVLNEIEPFPVGRDLKERAVAIATTGVTTDEVDTAEALTAFTFLLQQARSEGIPLTEAGYLKPVFVKQLAGVLPTMTDWPFGVSRENTVQPVLAFRAATQSTGLLRKRNGRLWLTPLGREVELAPKSLWRHLADSLVSFENEYLEELSVVLLVYMATSFGRIDLQAISQTMYHLGWRSPEGGQLHDAYIYDCYNDLWAIVGNVTGVATNDSRDRVPTEAGRMLMYNALFQEVEPQGV